MVLMNQVQLTNYKLNLNESLLNVFLYQGMLLKKVVVIVWGAPEPQPSQARIFRNKKSETNETND